MAEQPNITQILAALAAQRPGGTPIQGPPLQQPPQGYQTAQYPGPNPTGPAAYALPQPSTAGSVDLSNIKPSNSGSVSLADAIARARNIAAEKGVAYDSNRGMPHRDGDPRIPSRAFPRSRSRSRSPPRTSRDTFRDNYNPYRDERRDDPRRTNGPGFPRERSFSPGLAGRPGSFPPRTFGGPDERSPQHYGSASGDSGVETITIESALVGLIIGRQGENLRRVEAETSTRVQFITGPEATGPKRQCKITGTRQAREEAKAEIARIIEENGNPARGNVPPERLSAVSKVVGGHQPALRLGEDATQIMVPNRTVGLIIGRGGETIRDLQERSQCHVNIVGEEKSVNGLRPVNLIGTPQAATMAKDLIMEIVESDTKSLATQGGQGARVDPFANSGRASGGPGFGGFDDKPDKHNDSLTVPSDAVGMIIGKGGETIKDMQITTGCKINVAQPSGQDFEREIGLVGSRAAIEQAKHAIMEKVHAVEEKNRSGGGGGGGRRDDFQGDRYSQNQQPFGQQGQGGGYTQQQQPYQQQQPQEVPAEDDPRYLPYGGYKAYVALWYASLQQNPGAPPG